MFAPILFVALALIAPSYQLGITPPMGPVGIIDFSKVEDCKSGNPTQTLKLNLAQYKNQKVFHSELNLDEPFNKNWRFTIVFHKWTGSEYKKNVFKYEGPMCEYMDKFLPTLREKVYKIAKVDSPCDIPVGKYIVRGIYGVEKELKFPSIPYGKFQGELKIFNPKKKVVACVSVDAESKPK